MARVTITRDNVSPLLEIFIWFCLIVSLLTVLVRFVTKRYLLRRIDPDDYLILVSLIFASAQSITISLATSNGLGQRLHLLNTSQFSAFAKAQYAATFLFIMSVCCAKLSLVAYLRNLTPVPLDRKSGFAIGLVVTLWAVTAVFTFAFQCRLPRPWDYISQSCFDRASWANSVTALNILTDICLIILPLIIVARLKVRNSRKIILAFLFFARISVIIVAVCQIIYVNRVKPSGDVAFDIWPVTLCMQIIQCLSIFATCLVYLRPFRDSLETGFIHVDDLRRQHASGFGYSPEEGGTKVSKKTKWGTSYDSIMSKLSKSQRQNEDIELQGNTRGNHQNLGTTATVDGGLHHEWDAHSRSRILRTTTLTVE